MAANLSNYAGFDDGPFSLAHRGDVPLIGAVMSQARLDGVLVGRVRRDGVNSTAAIADLVLGSKFDEHIRGVMLSGITFAGFNVTVLVHTDMASPHIERYGSPEQLDRYMPGIVSGDLITAVAVTEPGGGSDVANLRTRAERSGNGWVLNGAKMFITNGVHADVLVVAARTDPQAKGSRGISMFVVERDAPGFSVGRALDKMGWRCSDTAELVFDDCRLPASALLGEENQGFYAIMRNFQNERIVIGAMAVGESQKAIDLTAFAPVGDDFGQPGKIRLYHGEPLVLAHQFAAMLIRGRVAVEREYAPRAAQLSEHRAGVAPTAEGAVHVAAVRPDGQPGQHLIEHHGLVDEVAR